MKYILLDYVNEAGGPELTREEQAHWLGVYRAYMEAMQKAGGLKSSAGLQNAPTATTVRIRNDKKQVLDRPYAHAKKQMSGIHIIEVPDLDGAVLWAARSPTALHGVVEVRPMHEGTFLTEGIEKYLKTE